MSGRLAPRYRPILLSVAAILLAPSLALAQSPWERAASNLALTFTGPLARSLARYVIYGAPFPTVSLERCHGAPLRLSPSASERSISVNIHVSVRPSFQPARRNTPRFLLISCSALRPNPNLKRYSRVRVMSASSVESANVAL